MKKLLIRKFLSLALIFFSGACLWGQADTAVKVFVYDMKEEIAKPAWRTTQIVFEKAAEMKADYILLHMNTYGGRVDIADSIRTKILNSDIPVLVFIDNQAISAGSLISIACDSIYMRPGGSIGAATVVNQTGEAVPDKYQSFMRSTMRATAEAHGKDTIINGTDTTYRWHRDPKIAEAMVDPRIYIPGVIDSGRVLTLTAEEAIRLNFCEGLAQDIPEVLSHAGIKNAQVEYYKPGGLEIFIRFLLSTPVQGILIMLIIGGLYFELQSPGIGLPLGLAIFGAIFFFFPLYIEGLAENWELIVFFIGLVLIGVEIFVVPGFGVTGVLGIIFILAGLTLSLIDNIVFEFDGMQALAIVTKALLRVIISVALGFGLSIYISQKIGLSGWFKGIALETVQDKNQGYISSDLHLKEMIGKTGTAYTVLRPSGRIMIDNDLYDAQSEIGYIEQGEKVKVSRNESGQLYVMKQA